MRNRKMFTGIVEEVGTIESLKKQRGGLRLRIRARKVSSRLKVSESVAINGACMTVVSRNRTGFEVLAVEETLGKTALGSLGRRSKVNLERPLMLTGRLGGHLLMGHVDCVGVVRKIEARRSSWMFTITYPRNFSHYVILVGSIAVDGVSLTVADLGAQSIRVSIIPHTWEKTIFQFYRIGDRVNLEFDVLGKYLERWVLINRRGSALRHVRTYLHRLESRR